MDDATPAGNPAGPGGAAGPPAPPGRGARRPRDMAISLLVLLIPVLLLVGGYQLLAGRTQPVEVDPAAVLAQARRAGFDPVEPAGLAPDWALTSAGFDEAERGGTLRLGYVPPEGGSMQLIQSTVPAEVLLADRLAGAGPPTGAEQVGGATWQRYTTERGEQALVLLRPEETLIVVGIATDEELRALAAAAGR